MIISVILFGCIILPVVAKVQNDGVDILHLQERFKPMIPFYTSGFK